MLQRLTKVIKVKRDNVNQNIIKVDNTISPYYNQTNKYDTECEKNEWKRKIAFTKPR